MRNCTGLALTLALLSAGSVSAVEFISPEELKPGMKGYGLSVFSGQRPERFEVEIIDVMPDIIQNRDMILFRASGMDLEKSGIIAGMSGSPVYVDDKLVGAVAYGWDFAKDPVGGITPIGEMVELWDMPSEPARKSGSGRLLPAEIGKSGFSPLSVPVALSAFSPGLVSIIGPALEEHGLMPVAAAGNPASTLSPAQLDSVLVPGGVIGVPLIDGDISMGAIGTITHREGDRLLAFGHPMFQAGAVEIPVSAGIIHTILPSTYSSFKLFSTTDVVGTMTQDRYPAVGCVIGPKPFMTPVHARLKSPVTDQRYEFRTVDHPGLTPLLVGIGLAQAVFSTEGTMEEMTLTSTMTVTVEDTAEAKVRHTFAGENPADPLFRTTVSELQALTDNRIRPLTISGVDFDLEFEPGQRVLRIAAARLDRRSARPGETVGITLDLQSREGEVTHKEIEIELPLSTPAGRLRIAIAARDSLLDREAIRAPGLTDPGTVHGLLRLLEQTGNEDELVVAGFIPAMGLTVGDAELPSPPPSVRAVIRSSNSVEDVQPTAESKLFEKGFPMDNVVSGVIETELEVRR
jgi:hypothetical protein